MNKLFFVLLCCCSSICWADTTRIPGTVYSKTQVTLRAEQTGQLTFLLDVGDKFAKGDLLAQVDYEYEQQQLALLQQQRANTLAKLKAQKEMLGGYDELSKKQVVSQENKLQKQIAVFNTQNELHQIELKLLHLNHILRKKRIEAPFAGVVTALHAAAFESLGTNQAILTVFDPSTLHIKAKIPVKLLSKMDFKQATLVQFDKQQPLTLEYIIPKVGVKSNTVEVSFEASVPGLLVGQPVQIQLIKL